MNTMQTIQPIETRYKGYRFRSRTEARWAVFFDALGLRWEYEMEGFDLGELGWYLPDFWLPDWGMWVEVKPTIPTKSELDKFKALARHTQPDLSRGIHEHMILCGSPGRPKFEIGFAESFMRILDGYVALVIAGNDEFSMTTVSCFAMMNGGKELDIWPLYVDYSRDGFLCLPIVITPQDIKGDKKMICSIDLEHGLVNRFYFGKGVRYLTPNILTAYTAARSARFEHGEQGR